MPRPATLPLVDWKAVFDSGLDDAAWCGKVAACSEQDSAVRREP